MRVDDDRDEGVQDRAHECDPKRGRDRFPVRSYADAAACDTGRFAAYFRGMLRRGIYLPPSQFEAFFISTAHTEGDVDRTIEANREALAEAASQD